MTATHLYLEIGREHITTHQEVIGEAVGMENVFKI
jgi:hypothetical protein